MTTPMIQRLGAVTAILMAVAASAAAQAPPVPQDPPPGGPPVAIEVTVTAAEARSMEASVKTLKGNRDPFLSGLGDHVLDLTAALALRGSSGRPWTIGPLTASEAGTVALHDYFFKYQVGRAPISVQVLRSWGDRSPEVFTFTASSFLAMLAAISKGPLVQVPIVQQQQILFLGRMIVDLNEQAGGVIPDSTILGSLATVFRDKRVGERVVAICAQMTDDGGVFDLVPRDLMKEFDEKAGPGFFVRAPPSATRVIRLRYNEETRVTRPDDLVWSYLRFFSGDNSNDWAVQAAARSRAVLARKTLDYLEAQIQMQTINALSAKLDAAQGGTDVPLGEYLQGGVIVSFLKNAPLTTRVTVTPGARRVALSVEARKISDLRRWLEAARKRLVD